MEKRIGVVEGYSPVAGEWYPAIEYPYPKVYHEFVRDDIFEDMYPELVDVASVEEMMNIIENTKDGEEAYIKLTADIVDTETIAIPAGKKVKLNLNGHKISAAARTSDKHYYTIDNYGELTIMGTGLIEGRGIENFGIMFIKDGVEIDAIDTNGGSAVWNGYDGEGMGTLTVDGGIFKTFHEGSTSDYTGPGCLNNWWGTTVINGGRFESVNKRTYAVISGDPEGSITVNNAYIKGVHGGLAIDAGAAVVNRGTFISTEYYGLYVSNDAHSAAGTGPADADVLVVNGNFTGPKYSVLIGSDVHSPVDSIIKIKGGTYNKPLMVQNNVSEAAGIIYPEDKFDLTINSDGSKILTPKEVDAVEESTDEVTE